jgi:UDP-2,3-diacylglucosamine pyrophosphatase LpxH
MWRSRTRYHERVAAGLDKARGEAPVETVPAAEARIVIFSDLHRGVGDRADDFRPCRKIYHAALGYYASLDFRLFLLGDIEELWERLLVGIVDEYEGTLELEKRFFDRGKATRFLGNHDEALAWPWNRKIIDRYTNDAPLREGLRLRLTDPEGVVMGEILFVHGHQGIHYTWFDQFMVKRFWVPIQKVTGLAVGTPSTDHGIRLTHERALYNWAAEQRNLMLVCGHTHHPVFMSAAWEQTLRRELEAMRSGGAPPETIAMKEAELHWVAADMDEMKSALPSDPRPCYFNTGCCSYYDGTITGIEIADGRIRLVRWSGAVGAPRREGLREAELASILGQCMGGHCDLPP